MHRCFSSAACKSSVIGGVRGSYNKRIGQLLIYNPSKLNAMTLQMYKDVPSACKYIQSSKDVRVCILSGSGTKAFGAGSDISEFPRVRTGREQAASYSESEDEASRSLLSFEYPLIAKIHGPCYGGALNLALAADLRYASEDATFCVPPAKLGIGYPRALMNLLVGAVGKTNAKQLLFTASVVDAYEAKAMGLVNAVVPKDKLDDYVDKVATNISNLAPLTIQSCKMELKSSDSESENATNKCYESYDYSEGVASFLEKRKAQFEGR